MRRYVLLGTCLALASAGSGSALAGARHAGGERAQRSALGAVIICPQRAGITTCCGPPLPAPDQVPINCCPVPTVVGCPPSLSISASPNPSTAGDSVTVSGVLTGLGGAEQIVLWQRLPGAHWRRAGQATTNSAGGYLITLANGKVKTNRDWYVAGDGLNSPMLREGVAAVVTLAVSPTTHLIHGAVTPSHAGEHVLFQLLRHDRWVTLAQPLLGQRSTFRVGSLHPSVSRGTVRAVFLGDARNIRSVSPVLTAHFARS